MRYLVCLHLPSGELWDFPFRSFGAAQRQADRWRAVADLLGARIGVGMEIGRWRRDK